MAKYRLFFAVLFAMFTLNGAAALTEEKAAPEGFLCRSKIGNAAAGKLLNQVQTNYSKVKTLSGRFSQQSFMAALDVSEQSTGSVFFSKPGKMEWNYEAPQKQQFILRDNTAWLYQPELNQVLIDKLDTILLSDLPVSFLMGIGDLSKSFTVTGACQSSLGVVLSLTPRVGKEGKISAFQLLVSPSEGQPLGARVTDSAGLLC